jgi:glycosyltransferase involved in cell wall biosynthesis
MSRFPKLTETFVLFEILAVEEHQVAVDVYPLLRARNTSSHPEGAGLVSKLLELVRHPAGGAVMHPEARPLVERAHFLPFLSPAVLRAQVTFISRRPRTYVRTVCALVRAAWGSTNFLLGALAIFPKTVLAAQMMERDRVSHVHAHFANHPATAALIIQRLVGIPYSFTAHGSDIQVDSRMLCQKIREASFVATVAHANRQLMIAECDDRVGEKIHVIRAGVDTEVFKPRERQAPDLFTILCVGTLYEVKGQRYLIDACSLLRDDGADFRCVLVGDGADADTLREQVHALELDRNVEFAGRLTRDEVASLLGDADVLVAPSVQAADGRREGIPVVLVEAMATETPVIATDISGISELVDDGENGILVAPGDAQAIAGALRRLGSDNELRRRMGSSGRKKVLREFDLRANAAALAARFAEQGT